MDKKKDFEVIASNHPNKHIRNAAKLALEMDKTIVVSMGRLVYEISKEDFNKLAKLQAERSAHEFKEKKEGYDDSKWNEIQDRYGSLYCDILKRGTEIIKVEHQFHL